MKPNQLAALTMGLTLSLSAFANLVPTNAAEPALAGAVVEPHALSVGQSARFTVDFVNSGFSAIPAQSTKLTVCADNAAVAMAGVPSGAGAAYFAWQLDTKGCWAGTTNREVPAFGGGPVMISLLATTASAADVKANATVSILDGVEQFNNNPANDRIEVLMSVVGGSINRAARIGLSAPMLTRAMVR